MWLRLAAMAMLTLAVCNSARAQTPVILNLDDAFTRVAETHPELRLFGARRAALVAEQARADLRPPLVLGAQLENVLGTGQARGLDSAELTLTLASVLERGGKLEARRVLAQSRIDALAVERETRRLDLLAEVARRYLASVAAKQSKRIAELDIAQRRRAVAGAQRRVQAGASPESVVLAAKAALARAEMEAARSDQRWHASRQLLAALWGERAPGFEVAASDATQLPAIGDFAELDLQLQRTPELAQFADEQRVREARLQLARSNAASDLEWQVGVRRLEATDETALIAGISMPLGSNRRARPEIEAAEADLASLEIERDARGLSLYATLAEAHGRYRTAEVEVRRLQSEVIPLLGRAEAAAERAYQAGAISYLEWSQLQSERTAARKQQLDAAIEAQRALIEIQRLTGQPFVAAPVQPNKEGTTP